jgi:hypothetical protein
LSYLLFLGALQSIRQLATFDHARTGISTPQRKEGSTVQNFISIKRAVHLAARITRKYDDEELTNDLLELLNGVADPNGSAPAYDAACMAMDEAYARSPLAERALVKHCRTLGARA